MKEGQERIMREEEEDNIVSSLHTILRPFLLRRLKTDGKYLCLDAYMYIYQILNLIVS